MGKNELEVFSFSRRNYTVSMFIAIRFLFTQYASGQKRVCDKTWYKHAISAVWNRMADKNHSTFSEIRLCFATAFRKTELQCRNGLAFRQCRRIRQWVSKLKVDFYCSTGIFWVPAQYEKGFSKTFSKRRTDQLSGGILLAHYSFQIIKECEAGASCFLGNADAMVIRHGKIYPRSIISPRFRFLLQLSSSVVLYQMPFLPWF